MRDCLKRLVEELRNVHAINLKLLYKYVQIGTNIHTYTRYTEENSK